MHPLFHHFKRSHLATLRLVRDYAEEFELTPARFDMLVAIASGGAGMAQNTLRRVLDVTAPVVSRMLRSLEKLDFVYRRVHRLDRRTRWICLTEKGRVLLGAAVDELLDSGMMEWNVCSIVSRDPADRRMTDRAFVRTNRLFAHLRERLADTSTLVYPNYGADGSRASPAAFSVEVGRRALRRDQRRVAQRRDVA